jgi:hypothetical protein
MAGKPVTASLAVHPGEEFYDKDFHGLLTSMAWRAQVAHTPRWMVMFLFLAASKASPGCTQEKSATTTITTAITGNVKNPMMAINQKPAH